MIMFKIIFLGSFYRSYYRCTSQSCNVKKRVERSFTDPSIVVTTYEGQHTHPCTVLPRGLISGSGYGSGFNASVQGAITPFVVPMQVANNNHFQMSYGNSLVPQQLNQFGNNVVCTNTIGSSVSSSCSLLGSQERCNFGGVSAPLPLNAALLTDHGLLQDILPSIMKKQE